MEEGFEGRCKGFSDPRPTARPPAQAYPRQVRPEAIHPEERAVTEQLVPRVECWDLPGGQQCLHRVWHEPVHRYVAQSRLQCLAQSPHQLWGAAMGGREVPLSGQSRKAALPTCLVSG